MLVFVSVLFSMRTRDTGMRAMFNPCTGTWRYPVVLAGVATKGFGGFA
jgi:hypothetical protein